MKIKQFFKKAAATVMAAVTVLSLLPTTAFAATGDVGTISFTRTYDSAGNAMYYNSSAVINGYTAGGTGKNKYRMYVDGSTAFCIQPGVPLKTGNQLTENSSETWNALSASQKKAVGLALLYGYQGNRDGLTGSDDEKWLATQTLVWEFVTGCRNSTGSFAQTDTTVYSLHFGSNYPNSGARAAYDQIVSMLTKHNTVPSFMNGSTRDLEYKDGQYVLTLTDTNGVLSEYSFSSSDRNVSVSKSGNTLTISSANAFSGSVRITATRNNIPVVSESAKLIAYGDPNLQDLVTGVENTDGVSAYLNVETPTGTIGLKKTSEDGKVEGITFTVEGNGIQQTVKTNAAGEILIDGLTPGVYTVTEQSYEKYEPQSVQRVTVIGGRTSTVTFNNVLKRGDLTVTKTSEDGLVEGMKFHLYGTSLSGIAVDEYAVTDSSGKAYFKDVLIGSGYVLEEVDTPIRYVVPESQTAAVEWNTVTEKSVSNVLKKWNATVTKSDRETGTAQGNAYLAGATYGIYKGDQLVDTYTTDANGQFITAYYVCDDDWSIREISPSEGYLLDETSYHVGAEPQLYTVEYNSAANDVNEQVIKGSIALIKHTDDGETKLETPEAGAEFSVYLKSSGSYDAAKDSERDTLICDENGFAQTKQLPYGIYTVHQVSGWEGRELLADFDVYIAKDGQVYRYLANNAKVLVSLDKVMEQNEKFGIGMNGEITAVTFGLYAKEDLTAADGSIIPAGGLLEILSVDENGHSACKTGLPFGSYCLKEISTDSHYILSDTEYPVVFEYAGQDTALVEIRANDGAAIENNLIYGEVQGMKKDDSGNALGGALIGLFAADAEEFTTDTAILTATSAEDGSFSFAQVPYGNWMVREIEAPSGYVLSEDAYPVTIDADGAVVEVEIENTLIRGTVQLTKVDKDYPDNKLTGAEFELYRDLNGNKELDAEDEKLGTLMEVSTGIYEMSELTYGSYLVKETKAPEGFYLDSNAYYFEITEHGKTVAVENEAGKGFINAAQVGSLKIIKTSSDGKVEGFSFRVTGANGYEQVFTTDKNGEIFVEGLRIGDYTISEISDSVSQNYVLPADKKATVFEGAVTKVEMHNELRDTPKTGDDSNPTLWIALMGIAAVGAVTCGVFGIKNKKKKEDAE